MGETKLPNKIPNLNQILFRGVRRFDFKIPNTRNTKLIIKDHNLMLSL